MSIEYFIGDTVEFRKKEYFVIGINPDRERPIALNNYQEINSPEDHFSFGVVTADDISLINAGSRKYNLENQKSLRGYAMVEALCLLSDGVGEPTDGVYPLTDEDGFVISDHDGNEEDHDDKYWNSSLAIAKMVAIGPETIELQKPLWDCF